MRRTHSCVKRERKKERERFRETNDSGSNFKELKSNDNNERIPETNDSGESERERERDKIDNVRREEGRKDYYLQW